MTHVLSEIQELSEEHRELPDCTVATEPAGFQTVLYPTGHMKMYRRCPTA